MGGVSWLPSIESGCLWSLFAPDRVEIDLFVQQEDFCLILDAIGDAGVVQPQNQVLILLASIQF